MTDIHELFSSAMYIIGLITFLVYLYDNFKSLISIIKAILQPYFQPNLPQSLTEKFGKWAVITGATDGIGREYAKELAKNGVNVVLISRTKSKLIQVTDDIEKLYKVKTKWIVADFSKGREIYEHIEEQLAGLPIGILVNNVGVVYEYPEELSKVPLNTLWQLINVNIGAMTVLSHMVIPLMKKEGKGIIVNISSGSELQPLPLLAVYGATKRYIKSLSLAMKCELAPYNISVQTVKPMFVVTKMNQYTDIVMRGNVFIPQVENYTKSLVYTLGKSSETTGYWAHALQYGVVKIVPECVRLRIAHILFRKFHMDYLATLKEQVQ